MTKQALHKIEEFVKVALSEISELQNKLSSLQVKQAADLAQQDRELDSVLKKAAEAMYNSDFINDEDEKAMFVKKAKEDSKYLAQVVERVCNAADVAYMGKVATVKSSIQSDDPVMRRAFGNGGSYSLLDADHEF
jgi:formate-dependent nitrite reductase cytochrome c552 subunit